MSALAAAVMTLLTAATPRSRLAVDTHLHVTMSSAAKPIFRGEPGQGAPTASTRTQNVNQVDADQLIASGTTLAVAALWPPFRMRPGRSALDESLNQLALLEQFVRRQPQFVIVGTSAEARAAVERGRIALIPAVEGGEGIESVGDLDRLYAAGARSVTLVHFADSQLGGAAAGQFAFNVLGQKTQARNPRGLTELGRAVVRRMLELGMLVDLAHASDQTSADVLAISEELGVPVINSHSGARALLDLERNIPDDLATRIARGGGMVGVTAFDNMVKDVPQAEQWPGYVPRTCDDVIAHWKHLASVLPPAQLNLGSDMNGMIRRPRAGGSCPDGLRNTGDLAELYDALIARGVPKDAVDGMGERFLKTWEALEKKSPASARAQALSANRTARSTFDVAM